MQGHNPEDRGIEPNSVEVVRRTVNSYDFYFALIILLAVIISFILIFWLTLRFWSTGTGANLAVNLVFVIFFIATFGSASLILVRERYFERAGNRIILDIDRACLLRDSRILRRIDFHEGSYIDIYTERAPPEDAVIVGYFFRVGVKSIRVSEDLGYSREDVERMWPVVVAAVGKHRMRRGREIKRIFTIGDG